MGTHVDFEFSKSFGIRKKGDVKSFYKPFAIQLQSEKKVGKILGPTVTKADQNVLDEKKKLIDREVESRISDLKKENADLKKENAKLKKLVPPSDKSDKTAKTRHTK